MGKDQWVVCKLGDVMRIRNGYAFKSKDFKKTGDIAVIKQTQLNGETIDFSNCDFVDKTFLISKKDFVLKKGDILLGMSGSLGKFCIYDKNVPALQNQRTGKVEPISLKHLEEKFAWYFLNTIKNQLKEKGKGLGVGNVSADDIEDLHFSLPPLNEQKRIVKKLDVILPKVRNARERLEKIPGLIKKFRQSILTAACSGKLTEDCREEKDFSDNNDKNTFDSFILPDLPESWQWVSITDLTLKEKHSLKAGPFGSSLKKEFYVKKGYKVYGQEQVINNDPFYGDYYIDDQKYKELESCRIKPHDVLISLVGTVGKVMILPNNCQSGIINPRLVKITFDLSIYNPEFFNLYFSSPILKSIYSDLLHGSTMDVLNLGIIKSLPYPLPPIGEQHKIVQRVEKMFVLADSLESKYKIAMERIEKIEQAVLAKAFRGELVEPDPNDEPAEELLKRILEEKTKLESNKKTKLKR